MFVDSVYVFPKFRKQFVHIFILGLFVTLLEVLRLAKRDLRVAPEHRKERKKARILSQTNSSMTDLSVLYSKVNDLWLLYTSYIIIVLWPSLWPKHITTKLPNGFQKLHPMIFALMVSTI